MNKSCKDRLFIDLGANKGQSILLYSKLFPEYNNLTDVITIEPTNDPKTIPGTHVLRIIKFTFLSFK